MIRLRFLVAFLVALLTCLSAAPPVVQETPPEAGDNVVLVTLDGARVEDVFGGLDAEVARSTLGEGETLEEHSVYRRFLAETPEARRAKLLPFFWGTLMREHGSIAGNVKLGSHVRLTNRHRFSYPGYAEILLGEAHDDLIKSNDPIRSPYPTVLEELRTRLALPASKVAVFASWSVFDAIVSHSEDAIVSNAGFEAFDHPDPQVRRLSRLQFDTPTPWDSVRHDVYTFRFAMAHLEAARPRVLYLALGETDDWAHQGRYDRVLQAYARIDRYLEELWRWLQRQDAYRDRTHLLITTDHGRGRTPADWRDHGARVDGAEDVWIAFVSPSMTGRGEWRAHAPLSTSQVAATIARWMGVDWTALRPGAGRPIE